MGYARALLGRDVKLEEEAFQKKATKKSLWGSVGRTLGGLGVMALTGGAVNPLTLGLLTGGASFLGGAIGAKAAGGKLTGGKFFQASRKAAQKELGAFGTRNITESLKSGITAGFGQAAKLQKAKLLGKPIAATPTTRQGLLKSMDFEGSLVGKGLPKAKRAITNLRGDISTGFENKTMDWSTLPEGMSPRDYQRLVGERQASYAASERFANQPPIVMPSEGLPTYGKIDKSLWNFETGYVKDPSTGKHGYKPSYYEPEWFKNLSEGDK